MYSHAVSTSTILGQYVDGWLPQKLDVYYPGESEDIEVRIGDGDSLGSEKNNVLQVPTSDDSIQKLQGNKDCELVAFMAKNYLTPKVLMATDVAVAYVADQLRDGHAVSMRCMQLLVYALKGTPLDLLKFYQHYFLRDFSSEYSHDLPVKCDVLPEGLTTPRMRLAFRNKVWGQKPITQETHQPMRSTEDMEIMETQGVDQPVTSEVMRGPSDVRGTEQSINGQATTVSLQAQKVHEPIKSPSVMENLDAQPVGQPMEGKAVMENSSALLSPNHKGRSLRRRKKARKRAEMASEAQGPEATFSGMSRNPTPAASLDTSTRNLRRSARLAAKAEWGDEQDSWQPFDEQLSILIPFASCNLGRQSISANGQAGTNTKQLQPSTGKSKKSITHKVPYKPVIDGPPGRAKKAVSAERSITDLHNRLKRLNTITAGVQAQRVRHLMDHPDQQEFLMEKVQKLGYETSLAHAQLERLEGHVERNVAGQVVACHAKKLNKAQRKRDKEVEGLTNGMARLPSENGQISTTEQALVHPARCDWEKA